MSGSNVPYIAHPYDQDNPPLVAADLLAAPQTHPDAPNTIWIDARHLAVSAPHALSTGLMDDVLPIYDSQVMVD